MAAGCFWHPAATQQAGAYAPRTRADCSTGVGPQGPLGRVHPAVAADQAGRPAGAPAPLVRRQDRPQPGLAGRRVGDLRRHWRVVVAAGHRRLPGGGLHPAGLRRPRRRPPADLPLPPRQRPGGWTSTTPTTPTPTTKTWTPTSASPPSPSPPTRPAPNTGWFG